MGLANIVVLQLVKSNKVNLKRIFIVNISKSSLRSEVNNYPCDSSLEYLIILTRRKE